MKKAFVIGINDYPGVPLHGCVNDAKAVAEIIRTNDNGSGNFDVRIFENVSSKASLTEIVYELFRGEHDIALLYFSGHGMADHLDTYLVTPDAKKFDPGVSVNYILKMANECRSRNRIIILDCCHAGATGSFNAIGGTHALIANGVTILAASKADESALEINGHGVFTSLLLEALKGGAADINGRITPGSIYAYIDQALGALDQRPVFKTNITEFVLLREAFPHVPVAVVRKIINYFPDPGSEFLLDPSFEETNCEEKTPKVISPNSNPENVEKFKDLQKYQSAGLIIPVNAPYMYFAAMESKSCRLTPLGRHYWQLAKSGRI